MTDPTLPPDDVIVERFFARQRAEILARVAAHETHRRERRAGWALAAAAAGVALLLGWGAVTGPQMSSLAIDSWATAIELPADDATIGDPLAAFGTWGDELVDAERDLAGLDASPLPPLSLELSDELLQELDEWPFPLPDPGDDPSAPIRG